MTSSLEADLSRALSQGDWQPLRDARIFLTGGTGFVGCWMLESFLWLSAEWALGLEMTVLSRSPDSFRKRWPDLARRCEESGAVHFVTGDVRDFEIPSEPFTHVIHAATPVTMTGSLGFRAESASAIYRTILTGTERAIELARRSKAQRFLLTSSGAVYGRNPGGENFAEDHPGGPNPCDPGAYYGEGKRAAEMMAALAAQENGFTATVARIFAQSGAYLPLDAHFAIGNFVRDAKAGGPIRIAGDGTPLRSYMYGADMAAWLWLILVSGKSARAYNVGSEQGVSILELAQAVAKQFPAGIEIAKKPDPGRAPERYVPSTKRIREELGAKLTFTLEESIARTADYAR